MIYLKIVGIYFILFFFELGCYGVICSIFCDVGIVYIVFFIKVFFVSCKVIVVKFIIWMIGLLKKLLNEN